MDGNVQVGGVYSVVRDNGAFGVVKVVAHEAERDCIHVRTFGLDFQDRPAAESFKDDAPGRLDDELGIRIAVLPVTRRVFDFWEPVWLFSEAVAQTEQSDLQYAFGMASPWDDLMYA